MRIYGEACHWTKIFVMKAVKVGVFFHWLGLSFLSPPSSKFLLPRHLDCLFELAGTEAISQRCCPSSPVPWIQCQPQRRLHRECRWASHFLLCFSCRLRCSPAEARQGWRTSPAPPPVFTAWPSRQHLLPCWGLKGESNIYHLSCCNHCRYCQEWFLLLHPDSPVYLPLKRKLQRKVLPVGSCPFLILLCLSPSFLLSNLINLACLIACLFGWRWCLKQSLTLIYLVVLPQPKTHTDIEEQMGLWAVVIIL